MDLVSTNVNILLKETCNRIKEIDRSIKVKKLNKGTMFYANRNFAMIEKRKYGLHIRILQVEDKDNILSVICETVCASMGNPVTGE